MTATSHTEPFADTDDRRLTANDIGQLENAGEVLRLFARLGYDVDDAVSVGHTALGLDADSLKLDIRQIHRIAADPDQGDIVVYLFEVRRSRSPWCKRSPAAFAPARSWRCWSSPRITKRWTSCCSTRSRKESSNWAVRSNWFCARAR